MPPVHPVGRGGAHPKEPARDRRPLRQLRLHPRAVTPRSELVIYCDGGARGNPGPAAIGAVVLDPSTDPPTRLATVSERIGVATNNVAEYRALVAALEAAREFPARRVRVRADSQLIVRQLEGRYRVKQAHLRPYYERARELLSAYEDVELTHVPREQNTEADALWWQYTGASLPDGALLPAAGIVVLEELAGLAACAWIVYRFGLADRGRRDDFVRSGRLRAPASP